MENWCRVRVLNGLPLTAEYTLSHSTFQPHTGRPGYDVEDITLHDSRGVRAQWAERQIDEAEWQCVHDQIRGQM